MKVLEERMGDLMQVDVSNNYTLRANTKHNQYIRTSRRMLKTGQILQY